MVYAADAAGVSDGQGAEEAVPGCDRQLQVSGGSGICGVSGTGGKGIRAEQTGEPAGNGELRLRDFFGLLHSSQSVVAELPKTKCHPLSYSFKKSRRRRWSWVWRRYRLPSTRRRRRSG